MNFTTADCAMSGEWVEVTDAERIVRMMRCPDCRSLVRPLFHPRDPMFAVIPKHPVGERRTGQPVSVWRQVRTEESATVTT